MIGRLEILCWLTGQDPDLDEPDHAHTFPADRYQDAYIAWLNEVSFCKGEAQLVLVNQDDRRDKVVIEDSRKEA